MGMGIDRYEVIAPPLDSTPLSIGRVHVTEKGAKPKRGLTLWRQVVFIVFWALPERVRPLFAVAGEGQTPFR